MCCMPKRKQPDIQKRMALNIEAENLLKQATEAEQAGQPAKALQLRKRALRRLEESEGVRPRARERKPPRP